MRLQYEKVQKLQKDWDDKPCSHPSIAEEYYGESITDSLVCSYCGQYLSEEYREQLMKEREKGEWFKKFCKNL